MQTLETYIEVTQNCETEEALFRQFDIFVASYGADVSSYHILAKNLRAIPIETGLVRQTFANDWVHQYMEQQYADYDPVLEQSRREACPFHWFDVDQKFALNSKQKQFLVELREAGLTDGIAIPVFGPIGTMAYFGVGTVGHTLDLTDAEMLEVQFACFQTHNRYMDLSKIGEAAPIKRLSPRETEVLSLIASGFSNNYIAERLGISENTVDTMLRRVFIKLGVNNRITAVLRGIGSGLILP